MIECSEIMGASGLAPRPSRIGGFGKAAGDRPEVGEGNGTDEGSGGRLTSRLAHDAD